MDVNRVVGRIPSEAALAWSRARAVTVSPDAILGGLLMLAAACGSFQLSGRIPAPMLQARNWQAHSVWFEADLPNYVQTMTDRNSRNGVSLVHPLYPLASYPAVWCFRAALGLDPLMAIRGFLAVIAALWMAALFCLLRLMGCARTDAALLSLLAMSSAAAVFWLTVPESYGLGSLTMLLACGTVLAAPRRAAPAAWHAAIGASTLGITLTNWVAALLSVFAVVPWRRALRISLLGFGAVVALTAMERPFFHGVLQFPFTDLKRTEFILPEEAGGPVHIVRSLVWHSMVMPEIRVVDRYARVRRGAPIMTTQASPVGSGSGWGMAGAWLWAGLLGMGAWSMLRCRQLQRWRIVVALMLVNQLALHLCFGEETFLYALHVMPFLIMVAAFAMLTPARRVARGLAAGLLVCAAANNLLQFGHASRIAQRLDLRHATGVKQP